MNTIARKRFGQNFLVDSSVLHSMIEAINPQESDHFLEIGPGHGELTQLLLPRIQKLDVIEIDRDLVDALGKKFIHNSQLTIHSGDVLKFNFDVLNNNHQLRVCGNLPYNISTPLLFKLFSNIKIVTDMHFLLQKEVVQRLTAKVNSSQYGRLSVMSQYFCKNTALFDVGPQSFRPPPQVDSSYVQMIPSEPSIKANDFNQFSLVVREAFSHRRKTLRNALKQLSIGNILEELNFNSTVRPQEVTVEDYIRISNAIKVKFDTQSSDN